MNYYREDRKKAWGLLILILLDAVCIAISYQLGITRDTATMLGSFASIAVCAIVCALFKVKDSLYYALLVFVFMASPLGSVIDLYRSIGPYDKIVHVYSGFLLVAFGMLLIDFVFHVSTEEENLDRFIIPMIFAAFFFSSASAGIWEIFEFTADRLAGGTMQRGMVDTVTDMIAGNIGALLYAVPLLIKNKEHIRAKK